MSTQDRMEQLAAAATQSGLTIVNSQVGAADAALVSKTEPSLHGVEPQLTARAPKDETEAILAQWKTASSKVAAEQEQQELPSSLPPHVRQAIERARAEKERQAQSPQPQQVTANNGSIPPGREAPRRAPGLRFLAIVIDGQVVEGMTATERLVAALTSDPVVVDVTDQEWLPQVGDYYNEERFVYNPEGGVK